jgi:hypothetical protein
VCYLNESLSYFLTFLIVVYAAAVGSYPRPCQTQQRRINGAQRPVCTRRQQQQSSRLPVQLVLLEDLQSYYLGAFRKACRAEYPVPELPAFLPFVLELDNAPSQSNWYVQACVMFFPTLKITPGHARRTATAVIRPAGPPPTMATSTVSYHSALKGVELGIALNLLQE